MTSKPMHVLIVKTSSLGDVIHTLEEHEDAVTCLSASTDGKLIVSGSKDKIVRNWDGESGESVGKPLRGHEREVCSVAVSGDGRVIVSVSIFELPN
ncbi:MAG: hypothetical protein MI749_07725, partial [Desulfovibrionales bacterium]|nr:hypothetical protein [Desulfovibrionales bacterium]